MSGSGLRVAQRLRAKVLREVPLWGLRAPARVGLEGGVPRLDCEDPRDHHRARGFVDAAAAMPALDMARRTWSGRLAELLGERTIDGARAPELDLFVRTLGFRREAERSYRKTPHRDALDAYAAGVNGWVDTSAWSADPFWGAQGSRPRLWAPADTLLLHAAPAQVDDADGLLLVDEDSKAQWPDPWDRRLRALWAVLGGRALRADGGLGGGAASWSPGPIAGRQTPTLHRIDVLPGGDNNRVQGVDGRIRRLHARRHDVTVRGADDLRPWIRASEQGAVISDLLQVAAGPLPPAGEAFLWSWPLRDDAVASPRSREPLQERAVPAPRADLPLTRLVPLQGGA